MIDATITGGELVIARLEKAPASIRQALSNEVKRQWFRIQAEVVRQKLSGDPLHRRTGVLASSINAGGIDSATVFSDDSQEIVARIGTKVRYGRVHEEGGTFTVREYVRKSARKRDERGRFKKGTGVVRAHTVTFPQRAFLRPTLNDMRASVLEAIRNAVMKAAAEV